MAADNADVRLPPEIELPLVWPIGSRDGGITKDSMLINARIYTDETKQKKLRPRPGCTNYLGFDGGGVDTCQGVWMHNNFLLAAAGNKLSRVASPTSSGVSDAAAWSNLATAPWRGRDSFATAVFKNQIFVIGGTYDGVNMLSDVWATNDGANWQMLASALPWGERGGHRIVVHNNRLYLMGGVSTAGTFLNDVWVTDDGISWVQITVAAGWSARTFFGCVSFKNGIWVIGGSTGGNEVWFSVDGNAWTKIAAAAGFAARANHGCVIFNNQLYVVGGDINGREIWASPDGLTWTLITNLAFSSARYAFGCVVYNGKIVVIAGFITAGARTTEVWVSTNATASAWALATAAYGGVAVYRGAAVVFQAMPGVSTINAPVIYFYGGSSAVPNYLNLLWTSNVNGNLSTTYTLPSFSTNEPLDGEQCNNNRYFVVKNTSKMAVWYTNETKQVVDTNYPSTTVPGLVNLDETMYVMDPDGIIYGSAIADPLTWPSFNYIGADYKADKGVAITRYQNFLLALGQTTFQLFYDSGDPKTALRPYQSANIDIGCLAGYTLKPVDTTVMWLGRTMEFGSQVFIMNGLTPTVISTPAVERMLNLFFDDTAWANVIRWGGDTWYILSCPAFAGTFSLAFNLTTKLWGLWTKDNNTAYYNYQFACSDGVAQYVLSDTLKQVAILGDVTSDAGLNITCGIRTGNIDHDTTMLKHCGRLTFMTDRLTGASWNINVRYSDDDYNTWSASRAVSVPPADFPRARATATRWGSYRTRAWEFLWSASGLSSSIIGISAIKVQVTLGNN
jgi:hypothetical protein